MINIPLSISVDYWQNFSVTKKDIEFIQNHLFETEIPLTAQELASVLIHERINSERETALKKQQASGKVYFPKEAFQEGDSLLFPALNWRKAKVADVRAGNNPDIGAFDVLDVIFEDGSRKLYAAKLESHKLNEQPEEEISEDQNPASVISVHGHAIGAKIEKALAQDDTLVSIAGRWFPRSLLLDVNVGHLNLAEAILEMEGGEPMTATRLLEQLDLSSGVNAKLAEFSLNYALQEDRRFDEVGPAGQILWCLERLEPEEVRNIPTYLQYKEVDYDHDAVTSQMIALDAELDDELSDLTHPHPKLTEATICLTYPHWRAGTLPVSARLRQFFPTAYESARVRFTFVDGKTGENIPAWVVRQHGYVFGLAEWFKKQKLFPGALIVIRKGNNRGEVIIEAKTHKPTRDWVRTVIAGSDGGLVFAVLKQDVGFEYNDRMVAIITDPQAVDQAWQQASKSRQGIEQVVANIIRELSKLTPQGHVHAQELYSAINILRRVPPAPLMALLAGSKNFVHIGDLYFRLREADTDTEE
jgi:hypothetical protein